MKCACIISILLSVLLCNECQSQNMDLVEVTSSTTPGGFGSLEKCGEGSDEGRHACVPYHLCDGTTKTIVKEGVTDGFGLIDIRFGENSCDHFLDVCCKIPEGETNGGGGGSTNNGGGTGDDRGNNGGSGNGGSGDNGGTTGGGGGGIYPPTSRPPTPRPTTPGSREPPISRCGIKNDNGIDFKITGNLDNEAEYGEFPWMVAILLKNFDPQKDEHFAICGGSIIHPSVILTGAHCVDKRTSSDLKVRAGEWDTQTENERLPYQERNVAQIIMHEKFHPNTLFNDVALLVLDRPLKNIENIGSVCLPPPNFVSTSRECYVTGWGKNVFGKEGQRSVILKKIDLPMVSHQQCQSALRSTRLGSFFELDRSFTCAGGVHGKDACTGDGGSPLVCPDPQNPSRYIQTGIVAWGIGCGEENIPGVYGDVGKFRSWIDQQMTRLNFGTKFYTD